MMLYILILLFSAFTGLFMELYKKSIRKDRARDGEITSVAFSMSVLLSTVLYLITKPGIYPEGLNRTPPMVLVFSIAIYIFQLPACMAIWKPLVRKWIERRADAED